MLSIYFKSVFNCLTPVLSLFTYITCCLPVYFLYDNFICSLPVQLLFGNCKKERPAHSIPFLSLHVSGMIHFHDN